MIIGHKKQRDFLEKLAKVKEKLPHAYLFAGEEKLGKKTIAIEWISTLFGQDVSQKQHPDLVIIEPLEKEIQILQIRDLIKNLSMRPYSANFKAVIINEAHLMNQEAQGALLKTLEEPKGNAIIILISSSPEHLLPTILSRVETIKFYPVEKAEIKSFLKGKGVTEQGIVEISDLSHGKPGTAHDFVADSKKLENIYLKVGELEKLSESDTAVKFQYAKDVSEDNNNLKEMLDIWLNYFRGLLLENVRAGNAPGKKYSLAKLKKIIKTIQSSKLLISSTNASSRLVLETLMLEL